MGKCNICGKYITKNNLPSHKKLHFGEKPYYCDICAKSFSRRIDLKRHIKIHGPREKLGLILSSIKLNILISVLEKGVVPRSALTS